MAKGPMYVKDFDFSSAGKTVGYCGGGSVKTKMASGGYYAKGGMITEAETGETYPSRAAMVKHEAMETPRMQKQEMVQKSVVKAPLKLKAGRASAGKAIIPPQMPTQPAMKKGGFVEGGGMIPNKGSLGVKNNKDPGERDGKAPVKSHPNYNFKKGGTVKKYAMGGPSAAPAGALQAMRAMQEARGQQRMAPPARPMAQMPARPMAQAPQRPAGPPPAMSQTMRGGAALKKGGAVPKAGQYKIPKVMDEFKSGKLHSGSKSGPEVTSRKQALAIAISEARKAGKK
jgi:hypothetical protein